jgi:heme exporter protein A
MAPTPPASPAALRLAADGLACRRAGRRVFSGVSFSLASGEALLVTGRNGAGKSSLLAIVAGFVRAEAGTVRGEGLAGRTLPEALHLVAHRDGLKTALTAAENLAFAAALLGGARLSPEAALARVGLPGAADLPVAFLSAGQRRRVALARLLVAHRPLWLLDEPTTALDADGQAMLVGLLGEHLAGGGLLLAATHAPLPIRGAVELRLGSP